MNKWENGEKGPDCFCGQHTQVLVDGEIIRLLCSTHTIFAGAMFPLTKEKPDNWPNLSDNEMSILVDAGYQEQHVKSGAKMTIDMDNLAIVPDNKSN